MIKLNTLLFFILFFATASYSQISGDIIDDNRKLMTDYSYVIEGHVNGRVTVAIAVNAEGEVSSAKVVDSETTIKSTPAKIKAVNHVKQFEFEPGTWFPKFHQGEVVITMIKPK